jgi:exosome complex component RRP41
MTKENNAKEIIPDYKKDKKRVDGRKMDELRPISIKVGVIPNADGSAYLEWGQNKVYAAVYGPREALPKHTQNSLKAVIKATYRMTPFSVPERKQPRPNRRDMEISKVLSEALDRAVFTEQFPNTEIAVFVQVVDSNAGSRVACLTAASVALADAGIPMRDMISAVGVGKAFGELIVDLNKDEEDAPDAVDIPMAVMPSTGEIVLLQMDGLLKKEEWVKVHELGIKACNDIFEIQKKALLDRFDTTDVTDKTTEKIVVPKVAKAVAEETDSEDENSENSGEENSEEETETDSEDAEAEADEEKSTKTKAVKKKVRK